MKEFQRDIFGTTYVFRVGEAKELGLDDKFSGDTDIHTKVIRLRTDVDNYDEPGRAETIIRKTLIHEMAHATLYETGLLDYFDDETLVQWFEVMFPKLTVLLGDLNVRLGDVLSSLDRS